MKEPLLALLLLHEKAVRASPSLFCFHQVQNVGFDWHTPACLLLCAIAKGSLLQCFFVILRTMDSGELLQERKITFSQVLQALFRKRNDTSESWHCSRLILNSNWRWNKFLVKIPLPKSSDTTTGIRNDAAVLSSSWSTTLIFVWHIYGSANRSCLPCKN